MASRIIDYSPRSEKEKNTSYNDASLSSLVRQISVKIDQDSRFIIIGMSLGKVIEGIRNAAPDAKKNGVSIEVVSFINKSVSNIAHPFNLSDDKIILVLQTLDTIDLELFVHQLYNSIRNFFVGCPGDNCSIMKSRARIFPQDGNDMMKLLQEVL
jgi:hypothetical protein